MWITEMITIGKNHIYETYFWYKNSLGHDIKIAMRRQVFTDILQPDIIGGEVENWSLSLHLKWNFSLKEKLEFTNSIHSFIHSTRHIIPSFIQRLVIVFPLSARPCVSLGD